MLEPILQTSLRDAEQRANLLGSVREEIRFVGHSTLAVKESNLTLCRLQCLQERKRRVRD